MSQAELDKILHKYNKKVIEKAPSQLLYTQVNKNQMQRKKQSREHMITFMDHNHTPTKQLNDMKILASGRKNSNSAQLLKLLDQTEEKFVKSQKNYAEISRKYQKLKQNCELLESQLEKERKIRLQQLIDVQNKLHLLQIDNDKNITKLQSKQHTIAVLKQKLAQKQQQALIFQQQLQLISKKLSQTLQLKQKQSLKLAQRQILLKNQQASKSLQQIKQKYEKHISLLNSQLIKFNTDLLQKQKQKRRLLQQIQHLAQKHLLQSKQLKQIVAKNEDQYKNWLDQAKQQKLNIIQKYQQQIRQLRKDQFTIKLQKQNNSIQDAHRNKIMIKELEIKNNQLLNQLKNLRLEREGLTRTEMESQIKINNIHEELKHIKGQYLHQINQNKKLLLNLKNQQQKYDQMRIKNNRNEIQLQSLKRKCQQVLTENKRLQKQIQNLRADMGKQLKSLINVKKQLNQATDNQMNMNSVLTQATIKMKTKIQSLQQQLQSVTTQLYAQRLQKAKIIQQLQQTKIEMKRQYQLSLQNTKQQLEGQIKQNLRGKGSIDMQKQKMYLQMFKLQRQYELLKSQVVTSDEMLKMGTKMFKYYQRKSK